MLELTLKSVIPLKTNSHQFHWEWIPDSSEMTCLSLLNRFILKYNPLSQVELEKRIDISYLQNLNYRCLVVFYLVVNQMKTLILEVSYQFVISY